MIITDDDVPDFDLDDEGVKRALNQIGILRQIAATRANELAMVIIEGGEANVHLRPFEYAVEENPLKAHAASVVYVAAITQAGPTLQRIYDGSEAAYSAYAAPPSGSASYQIDATVSEHRLAEFFYHIGQGLFNCMELCVANRAQARINVMAPVYTDAAAALRLWDSQHPKKKEAK